MLTVAVNEKVIAGVIDYLNDWNDNEATRKLLAIFDSERYSARGWREDVSAKDKLILLADSLRARTLGRDLFGRVATSRRPKLDVNLAARIVLQEDKRGKLQVALVLPKVFPTLAVAIGAWMVEQVYSNRTTPILKRCKLCDIEFFDRSIRRPREFCSLAHARLHAKRAYDKRNPR